MNHVTFATEDWGGNALGPGDRNQNRLGAEYFLQYLNTYLDLHQANMGAATLLSNI